MNTTILKSGQGGVQAVRPGDLDSASRRRAQEAAHPEARPDAPTDEPAETADGSTCGTTQVLPLELDGVVHAIEVRCACGEVTVVEFDYPRAAAAPAPAKPAA